MILFDKLFEGKEEIIKGLRKPLIRKSLKRKIRSGWDDAQGKIDKANIAIEDEIRKVTDIDIQYCLEQKSIIRTCKEMQEDLEEMYRELFEEALDPDVE
jgi:hypothetical protein